MRPDEGRPRRSRLNGAESGTDRPTGRSSGVGVVVLLVVLVVVGYSAGVASAVTTTVGFEEYAEGTPLTTQSRDTGIVFEAQEGQSAGAIVRTCGPEDPDCPFARRGQNVVSTPVDGEFTREPLVASFTEPTQAVRLYVRESETIDDRQRAALVARDASGTVVARTSIQFDARTGWHPITVSTQRARIDEITLTMSDASSSVEFSAHNRFIVDDLTVSVNSPPRAVFDYAPDAPTVGEPVTFDASESSDPDDDIAGYSWTFDSDGAAERREGLTTTYVFDEPGTYRVTLEVDDGEAVDSVTRQVTVAGDPVAQCSVSDTMVAPNERVVVDASRSDADLVRFDVDGDGEFEETRENAADFAAAVSYPDSGSVTPLVRAKIGRGVDDQSCPRITVNRPPTASFDVLSDDPTAGEPVTFDASESFDSDGEVVNYSWGFGDESSDHNTSDPRVEHAFEDDGTHRVSLLVVDEDGGVDRFQRTVRVASPPPWDVLVGVAGGMLGMSALHKVRSRPDGRSEQSDEDTRNDDRENRPPEANVRYRPREPTPGRPTVFDGTASFDPDSGDRVVNYHWTVEDRQRMAPQFAHVFSRPGQYDVSLAVTDRYGATGTRTETVTVRDAPGTLVLDRVHPVTPGDDHERLGREYVVFTNGGSRTLDLGGWTVHDSATDDGVTRREHTFEFPEGLELPPDGTVTLHTGPDPGDGSFGETDRDRHLFWGSPRPVWDDETDVVVVEDDDENPALAVRYTRTEDGDYDVEPLDVEVLRGWFPDVVVSGRDDAPLLSVSVGTGVVLDTMTSALGFVAGAAFLRGPRSFLVNWATVAGFLLLSSATWGIVTSLGFVPSSVEAVIPLLVLLGALLVLILCGVGLVLWRTISALWARVT